MTTSDVTCAPAKTELDLYRMANGPIQHHTKWQEIASLLDYKDHFRMLSDILTCSSPFTWM